MRSTTHYWVQARLEHTDGAYPDEVALDETVILVDGERFRLFAAVVSAASRPSFSSTARRYSGPRSMSDGSCIDTSLRRSNPVERIF